MIYDILEISPKQMDELVDECCIDIISHRNGELYDSHEDPKEGVDAILCDFIEDLKFMVNEKMLENFVDENYDIKG